MLKLCHEFFADLERRGIDYVVWKSLENFEEQLQGVGDVDLCFLPYQREQVHAAFRDHAFLADMMSTATVDEDIILYRGFDQTQGVFVSLHAHFHCRFGTKEGKEYRYPHESEMVRDWHDVKGVHRLSDGHFMVIRIFSAIVKRAYDDAFIKEIGRRYTNLDPRDRSVMDVALQHYLDVEPQNFMSKLAAEGAPVLKEHFASATARLDTDTGRTEHLRVEQKGLKRQTFRARIMLFLRRSRSKLQRPAEIVLTGPDGAGKSTVCKLLARQFSTISSTYVIYLGRNRWSAPNSWINRWRSRKFICVPLNLLWPLSSTVEILLRVSLGRLLWLLGVTVLYDRSVYDIEMKYHGRRGLIARLVRAVSHWIGVRHGDLCYFTFADPEVAVRRKQPGSCTQAEVIESRKRFEDILDPRYHPLDTTRHSAEDIANKIISDYFHAACDWPERI